jgi:hypothetical protein
MKFLVQVPELRRQWSALMNEDLVGLPKEALISSIRDLASELLERTKNSEENSSNLVDHAKRELELIGEEPETIAGYLKVIQAFADMGHSGGSAAVAIPTIKELLSFKNLSPITNNPDEWFHHEAGVWGEAGGGWQCIRNPEAFSNDGGKTYYLLSEGGNNKNRHPLHESVKSVIKE